MGGRDIELKRVDDLVAEHMIGVGEAGRERQDDPPLAGVGEAAGALFDQAAVDVGLLEPAVRPVQHDRLPPGEGVLEHRREPRVPALRHPAGERGRRRIFA